VPSLYGTYGQPKKKKKKKKPSPAVTRTKPKLKKKKPKAKPTLVSAPTPKPKTKPKKAATRTKSLNASLSSADAGKRVKAPKQPPKKATLASTLGKEITDEHKATADRAVASWDRDLAQSQATPEGRAKADDAILKSFGVPSAGRSRLEERHGVDFAEERASERAAITRLRKKNDLLEDAEGDTPLDNLLKNFGDTGTAKTFRKVASGTESPTAGQAVASSAMILGPGKLKKPAQFAVGSAGALAKKVAPAAAVATKKVTARPSTALSRARVATQARLPEATKTAALKAKSARAKGKADRAKAREERWENRAEALQKKSDDIAQEAKRLSNSRSIRKANKADRILSRRTDVTRGGAALRRRKPTKAGVARYGKTALTTGPITVAAGGGQEYAKALKEDPLAVLGTTGKAALGIPLALGGIVADAGKSATGIGIEGGPSWGPLEGQKDQQLDYWKKVLSVSNIGELVGIDKAADPQKLIKEELGLVPLAGTALGIHSLGKGLHGRKLTIDGETGEVKSGSANYSVESRERPNAGSTDSVKHAKIRELALEGLDREKAGKTPTSKQYDAMRAMEGGLNDTWNGFAGRQARREEAQRAARVTEGTSSGAANLLGSANKLINLKGRDAARRVAKLGKVRLGRKAGMHVSVADILGPLGEVGFRGLSLPEVQARAQKMLDGQYSGAEATRMISDPDALRAFVDPKNTKILEKNWDNVQGYWDKTKEANTAINQERVKQGVSPILDLYSNSLPDRVRLGMMGSRNEPGTLSSGPLPEGRRYSIDGELRTIDEHFAYAQQIRAKGKEAEATGVHDRAMKLAEDYAKGELKELAARRGGEELGISPYIDTTPDNQTFNVPDASPYQRPGVLGKSAREKDLNPEAVARGEEIMGIKDGKVVEGGGEYLYRPHGSADPDPNAPLGEIVPRDNYTLIGDQHRRGALLMEGKVSPTNPIEGQYARIGSLMQEPYEKGFVSGQTAWARRSNYLGPMSQTMNQWKNLARKAQLPSNMALVPTNSLTPTARRGEWDAEAPLDIKNLFKEQAGTGGNTSYTMVNRFAYKEMLDQANPQSRAWRAVKTVNRLQSALLLAVSPAWFGYQLMASPAAGLITHGGPKKIIKAIRTARNEYKNMPPLERAMFEANFGGVSGQAFDMNKIRTPLTQGAISEMGAAFSRASSTPGGRAFAGLKKGGPLIALNRRFEAYVRRLDAIIEVDGIKKGVDSNKLRNMVHKTSDLNKLAGSDLAHLKGMGLKEQMSYYARNPKEASYFADRVNDALGDWNSLTALERKASSALVFYPFIRFSTNFLFRTLPQKHPAKLAMLANISQANVAALEEGGYGGDFRDFGNVLTHDEKGDPSTTLDLGRAAPGAGPILETAAQIGEGDRTLVSQLLGMTGPVPAGIHNVAFGKEPYSGKESTRPFLEQVTRAAASTNPVTRFIGRSDSPGAKAFRKIDERSLPGYGDIPISGPASALRDLVPDLSGDVDELADKKELSDLYEFRSKHSSLAMINEATKDKREMSDHLKAYKNGDLSRREYEDLYEEYNLRKERRSRFNNKSDRRQDKINAIIKELGISSVDLERWIKKQEEEDDPSGYLLPESKLGGGESLLGGGESRLLTESRL